MGMGGFGMGAMTNGVVASTGMNEAVTLAEKQAQDAIDRKDTRQARIDAITEKYKKKPEREVGEKAAFLGGVETSKSKVDMASLALSGGAAGGQFYGKMTNIDVQRETNNILNDIRGYMSQLVQGQADNAPNISEMDYVLG
jgi:hypothetical protein